MVRPGEKINKEERHVWTGSIEGQTVSVVSQYAARCLFHAAAAHPHRSGLSSVVRQSQLNTPIQVFLFVLNEFLGLFSTFSL